MADDTVKPRAIDATLMAAGIGPVCDGTGFTSQNFRSKPKITWSKFARTRNRNHHETEVVVIKPV